MGLRETLSKKLTPEMMSAVDDALGDDFDFDVVPRSRLNKVIKQRNELRNAQNAATQSARKKSADDEDEDEDDDIGTDGKGKAGVPDGFVSEKDHKKALKDLETKNADSMQALKIQYAALDKLRTAKAIDPELVFNGGLIDKTKLKFDDKGALTGLDEQVTELAKNKGFLFQAAGADKGTGKGNAGDGGKDTTALDSQLASVFAAYGVTPVETK